MEGACGGTQGSWRVPLTLIEFLFAVVCVANTVLLSLVLIELRYGFRMLLLQGSKRRQWAKEEHQG